MISGADIQYIASMHLARNQDDGKLVLRASSIPTSLS